MWARVVEILLACWLLQSPFLFRNGSNAGALWLNDLGCGLAVLAIGLLSIWKRPPLLHLATGLVGLWLVAFGILASTHPAPPVLQSDIAVGMLLMMFAIIPNEASSPPRAWRSFSQSTQPPGAASPPARASTPRPPAEIAKRSS